MQPFLFVLQTVLISRRPINWFAKSKLLVTQENVDVYVAETGIAGGGDPLSGSQAAPQQARITVDFLPDKNTAKEAKIRGADDETIDRLRAQFVLIPGAEIKIEKEDGATCGGGCAVEVSGDNFDKVSEATVRHAF